MHRAWGGHPEGRGRTVAVFQIRPCAQTTLPGGFAGSMPQRFRPPPPPEKTFENLRRRTRLRRPGFLRSAPPAMPTAPACPSPET